MFLETLLTRILIPILTWLCLQTKETNMGTYFYITPAHNMHLCEMSENIVKCIKVLGNTAPIRGECFVWFNASYIPPAQILLSKVAYLVCCARYSSFRNWSGDT